MSRQDKPVCSLYLLDYSFGAKRLVNIYLKKNNLYQNHQCNYGCKKSKD